MDDKTFEAKLGQLMNDIDSLPEDQQDKLRDLAEKTKARREKIKTSMGEMQESLDYLRLSIKYLVFDLEATRRENKMLREMLEEQQTGDDDHAGDAPA